MKTPEERLEIIRENTNNMCQLDRIERKLECLILHVFEKEDLK